MASSAILCSTDYFFKKIVKWMHTLETLQTNLQVCQVSQECLWQVLVWNVFWRLEHLYFLCMCISCKLVSSASREGMPWAFCQISFGSHTDFTPFKPFSPCSHFPRAQTCGCKCMHKTNLSEVVLVLTLQESLTMVLSRA